MRVRTWILIVAAALLAPTAACLPAMDFGSSGSNDGGAVTIDEARILASVANGAYRHDPMFAAVSRQSYASTAAAARINVWVTAADWGDYTRIAPDKSGSGASLEPGAIVVREVLDASGAVAKVTVMAKGPAGYNPTVGDFWFGVTTPDGTPVVDNGVTQLGKVSACFGCHMPRASDGFLFGVPRADRATPPPTAGGAGGGDDGGISPGDMGDCGGHGHGHGGCGGNEP